MDKDELMRAGIDYEEGVHRFGENTAIYEKYLLKFFAENELPQLRKALETSSYDAAFRCAHNMKGSTGNLSITGVYNAVNQIVEALRKGIHDSSLLELCDKAERCYQQAEKVVKR